MPSSCNRKMTLLLSRIKIHTLNEKVPVAAQPELFQIPISEYIRKFCNKDVQARLSLWLRLYFLVAPVPVPVYVNSTIQPRHELSFLLSSVGPDDCAALSIAR